MLNIFNHPREHEKFECQACKNVENIYYQTFEVRAHCCKYFSMLLQKLHSQVLRVTSQF